MSTVSIIASVVLLMSATQLFADTAGTAPSLKESPTYICMDIHTGEQVLDPCIWRFVGRGLGCAFIITLVVICLMIFKSQIDHGFLGLILLLVLIIFSVNFSFLVAAPTTSISIKIAIVLIDGCLAIGSKLLSSRFLDYLESE